MIDTKASLDVLIHHRRAVCYIIAGNVIGWLPPPHETNKYQQNKKKTKNIYVTPSMLLFATLFFFFFSRFIHAQFILGLCNIYYVIVCNPPTLPF